ncbi:E3 ubiquitin-protein ligase CIP8-like [Phoenix dactylifera]|uniref:E3 ubiquitin-protein ligase CIP8-like n=1 Tax=Phoenix dactylifera TaxID=42345 RepID=A0A8B8ZYM0_PHODC|nr:E3 ubiquitin-protein ligase CIP8-like [Phoenix dactylifera]
MSKVETHHLGDTVIQLQAHGVVQARPQVVVHLRVTEFDDVYISPEVIFYRFFLGRFSLPRAVPAIVSFVASNLDAKIRQLCERRLLRFASQPAVEREDIPFVHDYYLGEEGGFGGVPARKSFIESLGWSLYGRGEGVREEECVICLEDFDAGAEVSMTPCSHSFHRRCITQWLEKSHLCPICRYRMPASRSHR